MKCVPISHTSFEQKHTSGILRLLQFLKTKTIQSYTGWTRKYESNQFKKQNHGKVYRSYFNLTHPLLGLEIELKILK